MFFFQGPLQNGGVPCSVPFYPPPPYFFFKKGGNKKRSGPPKTRQTPCIHSRPFGKIDGPDLVKMADKTNENQWNLSISSQTNLKRTPLQIRVQPAASSSFPDTKEKMESPRESPPGNVKGWSPNSARTATACRPRPWRRVDGGGSDGLFWLKPLARENDAFEEGSAFGRWNGKMKVLFA